MGISTGENRNIFGFFARKPWSWFMGFFRPHYPKLLLTSAGSAAQVLLLIPAVLLVRYTFDEVIPQKNIALLVYIGLGIFALRFLNSLVTVWLRNANIVIINASVYRLRESLLTSLYGFSRKFYQKQDQEIIHTRIVQDTERLVNMSTALVSRIFPSLFISFGLIFIMFFLNWYLVLIILLLFPLILLANRFTGRMVKKRVVVFQRAFEKFSKGLAFVLGYMDLAVIQSAQQTEIERQQAIMKDLEKKTGKMAIIYAINAQTQEVLTGFTGIVIIVMGGIAVIMGVMSIGEFISFYMAAVFLNRYINTLATSFPEVIAGNESLLTLYELTAVAETEQYLGKARPDFSGYISLEGVGFKYEEKTVLNDISLEIKPGSRIMLTGPNGAGKTTILSLVLGLYYPLKGKVCADGIPYSEMDMVWLRRYFGVVMQNPPLFMGSILDNIVYGSPGFSRDDLLQAAKAAMADEFIDKLPLQYNTEIGEGGVLLSGGERQRLALARALLRRPKLLLLDEPANHLEGDMMRKIFANIDALPEPPAILLVSHDQNIAGFDGVTWRLENGFLHPPVK